MTTVLLQPEPTFTAKVQIHVPGKGPHDVEWTYKFRNSDEVEKLTKKWGKDAAKKAEADNIAFLLEIVSGWDIEEDFNRKNLEIFFRNYPSAIVAVISRYYEELAGVKRKN